MKLKMFSFDFEENILAFRVPAEVMSRNSFGYVPEGVEVDLGVVTGNTALGITELAATDSQKLKAAIAAIIPDLELNYGLGDQVAFAECTRQLRQLTLVEAAPSASHNVARSAIALVRQFARENGHSEGGVMDQYLDRLEERATASVA